MVEVSLNILLTKINVIRLNSLIKERDSQFKINTEHPYAA